jgi:hypothetical protein
LRIPFLEEIPRGAGVESDGQQLLHHGRQEDPAMGGAEMEGPAMAESAERLRGELSDKLELIRRAGGGC